MKYIYMLIKKNLITTKRLLLFIFVIVTPASTAFGTSEIENAKQHFWQYKLASYWSTYRRVCPFDLIREYPWDKIDEIENNFENRHYPPLVNDDVFAEWNDFVQEQLILRNKRMEKMITDSSFRGPQCIRMADKIISYEKYKR